MDPMSCPKKANTSCSPIIIGKADSITVPEVDGISDVTDTPQLYTPNIKPNINKKMPIGSSIEARDISLK